MKVKLLLFFFLYNSSFLFCQSSIRIITYGNPPQIDTQLFTNVGFDNVSNTTISNIFIQIDNSLDTSNYDLALIYDYINTIDENERQIIQNFIENGGHVVWVNEAVSNNPFTTINNIYNTNIYNSTFYAGGDSTLKRVHPSSGPAGLSPTQTINCSSTFSTMENVPNCNKLYSTGSDFDLDGNMFEQCTHTTLAIFPGRPKPNEGSILISSELYIPFGVNYELNLAIANLYYKLLVDENTNSLNDWSDVESNMNPNCPTVTASFSFGDTNMCVGDTIIFVHDDGQTVFYTTQDTGRFRLRVFYESGTCRDDTVVIVNYTDAYVDAGLDKNICIGDEVLLTAENPSNASINWNNGILDSEYFTPTTTKTYTVFSDKYGCTNKDSVKISVSPRHELYLNIKQDTSVCEGDEVILSANSSPGTTISWNNNVTNNTSFNPTLSNTYKVSANNNGCIEVDSIDIEVKPSPSLSIDDEIDLCEGELLLLNAESNGTVTWNGNFQNNTMKEVFENNYYTASSSLDGCIETDSFYVNIYPNPEPNFNVYYLGNSENSQLMYFENISNTIDNSFRWKLGFGYESNEYSVEKSYSSESDTILQIILFAENSNNCTDSIYKNIKISKTINEIVHVPTAFTPDDNSINDGLKPVLNFTPLDYTFSIFNRWGELIFVTDNTNSYWDGTFKGNKVADGLYTYKINYNTKIITGTFHLFK